jgi:hypothetical protein
MSQYKIFFSVFAKIYKDNIIESIRFQTVSKGAVFSFNKVNEQ